MGAGQHHTLDVAVLLHRHLNAGVKVRNQGADAHVNSYTYGIIYGHARFGDGGADGDSAANSHSVVPVHAHASDDLGLVSYTHADAYSHPDARAHADAHVHSDAYRHCHAYGETNRDTHPDRDPDRDTCPNGYADRNTRPDRNTDPDPHGHCDAYGHAYGEHHSNPGTVSGDLL